MAITDWTLFIQERLRAYDPTTNLNQGSPATVQVINPIVSRMMPDPIETKLLTFIMTRLQQEHPMLYAREGSSIMDLLVKPNLVLIEPLRREITSVKNQLTLLYPEQLNSSEADALVANFFISRKLGDYARVKVRLYFQNPVSVNIGTVNVAFTAKGMRFLPTRAQSITAEGMLTNWDGNLYYWDVNFIAERAGSVYNIGASEIIGVTGLSAATRVTNLAKANPGKDEETTSQLISRAERSLGERSLTTVPGIVSQLFDQFPSLTILQIIGFNGPEMMRDIVTGGNLGEVVIFGSTGATTDDGDADGYTWFFSDSAANFTAEFGPVGTDISSYELTAWYLEGAILTPHDIKLNEVRGATQISIDPELEGSDRLPDSLASVIWTIRKRGILTLSNIPGGILFPTLNGQVEIEDGVVHVGGCTDFYIRGGAVEDKSLAVELLADQDVLARREDAQTVNGSSAVILNDLSAAEFADIIEGETSLYLEEGSDEGAYRIIQKDGMTYSVRLGVDMTANAVDISFTLVDDVDVDLVDPKDIRFEGSDLRTIAGSPIVDTVSGTPDFVGVGVTDEDIVEILNGSDTGEYSIVSGGVTAGQITLASAPSTTGSPLQYRIFHRQGGISLPLLRVKSVELLDSGLEPTGELVPFRHSVDIRSRSFQNPGREATVGTSLDVSEGSYLRATAGSKLLSAKDLVGAPMAVDFWSLGLRPGDLLNINSTDNQGYYTVELVGVPGGLALNQIQVTGAMRWSTVAGQDMEYEAGGPSYGSFRLFFLDPVTFEATYESTIFSVTVTGAERRFRPDPKVHQQYLPTDVTIPTIVMTAASADVSPYDVGGANPIDLAAHMIKIGDIVEISYAPIIGSVDLSGGSIVNLDGLRLKIDVGYGTETVSFSGTSLGVDEIISQMNAQLSREVAAKYSAPAPATTQYVMLRADIPISLISDGAVGDATLLVFGMNRSMFHPWLDETFVGVTTQNDAPNKGLYLASALGVYPPGSLTLTNTNGSAWAADWTIEKSRGPFIRVSHIGMQQISSTDMSAQVDDLGFYYFDVECISEGFGTPWNIGADLQATAEGYASEGWEISVEDENLSYSMAERPWLHISPRILVVGNEADEANKIEIVGRNVQIVYERDPMVQDIHTYVTDVQTRVVVESPLVRSLFPKFVRTAITYRGGDEVRDVRASIATFIEAVLPEQMLEVSDIVKLITDTGSSYVELPITLVGIGHNADRSISVERDQDAISVGRLSALLSDDNEETVDGASYIGLTRII